jgi:hypothetical protein
MDATLLDALTRLVNLLDEPASVPRLAPLIQQEITVRLLTGPHGPQLRHLVMAGSPGQQIAKVVVDAATHKHRVRGVEDPRLGVRCGLSRWFNHVVNSGGALMIATSHAAVSSRLRIPSLTPSHAI